MKKYDIDGKIMCLKEIAEYLGMSRQSLYNNMKKFSLEEIVDRNKKIKINTEVDKNINFYKSVINKVNILLDSYIKNWYKGEFCLKDLEYIKELLNIKDL